MNIHLQISENPSQQSGAAIKLSGYYTGNKKKMKYMQYCSFYLSFY